jgi:uncharacterized protein DUF4105
MPAVGGSGAAAAQERNSTEEMIAKARSAGLSSDRYWQVLLHYRPTAGGGWKSLIDDPGFFLAPDGKKNPAAELEATLRGILRGDAGDGSIRCRFPARSAWLAEKLGLDAASMPPSACEELEKALAAADPRGTVLVFPTAHMNSPASMFGHTLLRVDNSYQSELLAYAVNYAAVTDETNGIAYAFKGIFGSYKGYYSILPYYDKVKEYNDMEHRDMWEYFLDLSPGETRRMLLHIWELRKIYSDYFFFDENCSYNLLFLLEAARPSARLADRAGLWVIPSDTLSAVRAEGLITRVKYRPSQAARIRRIAADLGQQERLLAIDLAEGRQAAPARPSPSAATLDLAAELLQYRYARREVGKEDFNRRYLSLLTRRSTLGSTDGDPYSIAAPAEPELGHHSGRAGVGGGYRKDLPFVELWWRPAYHDLLDPGDGYLPGAQISFLDTRLRYYPGPGELRLHRLQLVDIVSLAPWDMFFTPVSWKVSAGFARELHRDGLDHQVFRISTGGGLSAAAGGRGILYALGETDVMVGDRLENKSALGFGASAGMLADLGPYWKLHLHLRGIYYPLWDRHLALRGELSQNFRLEQNQSLKVTLSGERSAGHGLVEVQGGWYFYY